VAWGLTGDEYSHGLLTTVDGLMLLAWRDFNSFSGLEDEVVMLDFDGEFSFEHQEELTCVDVGVTDLAGAGRHEFFNDAELRRFNEVPAITACSIRTSPFVVFRRFCADDLCWHSRPPQRY